MKVITIIGARPQFVKAAMVSRALRAKAGVTEMLIHTGQHFDFDMSEVFFHDLGLPEPDSNLNVGGGTHAYQTGRMLEGVEKILLREKPDWALVYGDTNSTLAGALAAAKLQIPVAHVEAGLRSRNRRMPEEINRVATDHLSTLHFAPTDAAVENLRREGLADESVHLVGDVMYEAVLVSAPEVAKSVILSKFGLTPGKYILATFHRAENTGDPIALSAISDALVRLAELMPVVFPAHPRTKKALEEAGLWEPVVAATQLVSTVSYFDMVALENGAALVVTDSGGVQKEAFFCSTPCLTLRTETEWVELVDLGWNVICPPTQGADVIIAAAKAQIGTQGRAAQPYGNGKTAIRIVDILLEATARRDRATA